jgi:diguanylate cyclase (GGDEF)-like protein/PAS domain S-box-containing protein
MTVGTRLEQRADAHLPLDLDVQRLAEDAELAAVVRVAAALTGVPTATVNLLDADQQHQAVTHGFCGTTTPRAESLCAAVNAAGPRTLACDDLAADATSSRNPWVDDRRGRVRAYASAPLVLDGDVVGALCVFDTEPHRFPAGTGDRLGDLAAVVVALLQRRRQARELAELAAASAAARDQAETAAAHAARSEAFSRALLDALPVGVVAAEADGRVTTFNRVARDWHGMSDGEAARGTTLSGAAVAEYGLETPEGDLMAPADLPLARVLREGHLPHADMVVHRPGSPRRVVQASGGPVVDTAGRVTGAVVAFMDVTARCELEARLREAALHDPLTGLPNRALLLDRVGQVLEVQEREGVQSALLYCDLDGFKAINDTLGHAAGDAALVRMAATLGSLVRPGDTVARIGGDEFVVLCPGAADTPVTSALVERITRALAAPVDGGPGLCASTGVAISRPGDTADTLLRRADAAMYRVKRSCR